jgi:hypothetical protein
VTQFYDIYEKRGAAFAILIGLDDPIMRTRLREMRTWRRERLTQILRPASPTLRLPLKHAAAFAFVTTNHATWRALREDAALTQPQAIHAATTVLHAALFDEHTTNATPEPIADTA